jgi:hypothetical protein
MIISRLVVVLLLFGAGALSACTATADPPSTTPTSTDKPGATSTFPDMSGYAAANPDDYAHHFETAGRPGAVMTNYLFTTPDGIKCYFDKPAPAAGCTGSDLPGVAPGECNPEKRKYQVNSISTQGNIWRTSDGSCASAPSGKVLPPFHTLTVFGVVCGVDDKKMTACKDPQGRGFVLSPSWSGWLPHV